jgi:hypothetical protein
MADEQLTPPKQWVIYTLKNPRTNEVRAGREN